MDNVVSLCSNDAKYAFGECVIFCGKNLMIFWYLCLRQKKEKENMKKKNIFRRKVSVDIRISFSFLQNKTMFSPKRNCLLSFFAL